MSLAIIIVSYNTRDLLAACLESVRLEILVFNPQSSVSVIVVDNVSPDGSADMVRERFPWVHLIASPTNLGFAGGNNLALRALGFRRQEAGGGRGEAEGGRQEAGGRRQEAEGGKQKEDQGSPLTHHLSHITSHGSRITDHSLPDFVLLLNPDTTVEPGALATLLDFMQRTPQAGAVGARLSYPDGSLQHSAFAFPGLMQTALDLFPPSGRLARVMTTRLNGRYPSAWYNGTQPFEVETLLGACIFARREAIQAAGLLDEGFFMYAEELDWCRRIHNAGYKLLCVPTARIVHYEGQSTRQFREAMFVELWRSRLRLFEKHHGRLRRTLLRALVWLGATWGRFRADATRRAAYDKIANLIFIP